MAHRTRLARYVPIAAALLFALSACSSGNGSGNDSGNDSAKGTSATSTAAPSTGPATAPATPPADATAPPAPSGPSPSADGAATSTTAIPADFPIDAGLPSGDGDIDITGPARTAPGVKTAHECAQHLWPDDKVPTTDRLAVSATGPEYANDRELRVYADEATARAAWHSLTEAVGSCTSADGWRWWTVDADTGYDSVTAATGLAAGQPSGGIYQFTRVGNAILAVEVDGEFQKDTMPADGGEATVATKRIAPSMCVFSSGGCHDEGGAALSDADLITTGGLPALPHQTDWAPTALSKSPTLTCQNAWLNSLDPAQTLAREFRARIDDTVGGKVNTAVLRFDSPSAASAAYDVLDGMLDECDGRLVPTDPKTVGERPVTATSADKAELQELTYAASEVCTDCDATWFEEDAVALAGDRVVVIGYAELGGPLEPTRWRQRAGTAIRAAVDAGAP